MCSLCMHDNLVGVSDTSEEYGINHEENPPLHTSSGISLFAQLPSPGSGDHLLRPPLETKLLEGKVYGSLACAGKKFQGFLHAAAVTCEILNLGTLFLTSTHFALASSASLLSFCERGLNTLKESCPSVLTELLQYVARISEHSAIGSSHGNESFLDGSDLNSR
ncbi:hypothetical protein RHGRI_022532 [Rhododendron griersonianum]|uniref:Uncharacterized protein n=1 Tax=Rhododendron griersonianum TaxID=479676 RepID=A0AAV6J3D1_9ERIC|nr:hypothetical protein RHGRI_022532 [Rhododendron griersonianum]